MQRYQTDTHYVLRTLICIITCTLSSTGILWGSWLAPDRITIRNESNQRLIGRFFYHGRQITQARAPFIVRPRAITTALLPSAHIGNQRVLTIDGIEKHVPVGVWKATEFTIPNQEPLRILAGDEWEKEQARDRKEQAFRATLTPRAGPACVRENEPLTVKEVEYYRARKKRVHQSLETFLEKDISEKKTPSIGVAISGGGFRAMTTTMGLLTGLKKIGLLSAVLTIATLSGSSWAVAPLIASEQDPALFSQELAQRLNRGIIHSINNQYKTFARLKKRKKLAHLPVSMIDYYGVALSHTLIDPILPESHDHQAYYLSDLKHVSDPERHPFPLFTAAALNDRSKQYEWLTLTPRSITRYPEYTPDYTDMHEKTYSIPSWALHHRFENGQSVNQTLEPLLGYCLGCFGSSFSVSLRDAIDHSPLLNKIQNALLTPHLQKQLHQASWANKKLSPARVPNFLYRSEYPTHEQEMLSLVDGGYKNNLPIEPICRHARAHGAPLDLLIVLDNKRELDGRMEMLTRALNDCRSVGIPVPDITEEATEADPVTYWPAVEGGPAILYICLTPNTGYSRSFVPRDASFCATTNLSYTPEQYHLLAGLIEHNIVDNLSLFRRALTDLIE